MSENHNDFWDEKNLDGHDENGVGYRLDKYGRKCYKPTERWDPPVHEGKFKRRAKKASSMRSAAGWPTPRA